MEVASLTLQQVQQKISAISSNLLSSSPSVPIPQALPSLSQSLADSSHLHCDQCQASLSSNQPQSHHICDNKSCLMKLCSSCLFGVFELNGYNNTCPDCQNFLKFEVYQRQFGPIPRIIPVSSTTVEPEIKTLMTDMMSLICEDQKNEENDNRHVLPERTFGSLVKQWEKIFEVGCECGESHCLYPEPKKFVAGDLASLMRILRTICGASNERQLILLEILQKFIIGKVSAEQFVEQCEKYFITNTEYSKRSHVVYCIKQGLANSVDSYRLLLSFLGFVDRGMRYRATLALLKRYPKITFRCGRFFCFQCKLLTLERAPHRHHCAESSDGTLLQTVSSQIQRSLNEQVETESLHQILSNILSQFKPLNASDSHLEASPFPCSLCLEECEPERLFEGCLRSQCRDQRDRHVCKECMLAYTKNRIESSPFSLPQIKCVNCSHRIPTAHWRTALVSHPSQSSCSQHNESLFATITKYSTNYAQMRRSRCGSCHSTYTPFAALAPEGPASQPLTEDSLLQSFCAFLGCSPSIIDLTVPLSLEMGLTEGSRLEDAKKRKSTSDLPSASVRSPSTSSTRRQSAPINTAPIRRARVNPAAVRLTVPPHPPSPLSLGRASEAVVAPEGDNKDLASTKRVLHLAQTVRSFVREEISPDAFIQHLNLHLLRSRTKSELIQKLKSQISESNIHHGSLFVTLFISLRGDIERQAVAITALLKRYPHFKTKCCKAQFCYFCKISSFHPGQSCLEWMRNERGGGGESVAIKYCPSCSVPTVRSEGCSSITCLCGRNWSW